MCTRMDSVLGNSFVVCEYVKRLSSKDTARTAEEMRNDSLSTISRSSQTLKILLQMFERGLAVFWNRISRSK